MASISTGIIQDANLLNLKEIPENQIRSEIMSFLVNGEVIVQAFQTIRDQVVFTNKRIFVVNVQGLAGKKISYISYPYSKVVSFGVETAGLLDIDSELLLTFTNGLCLQFDFKSQVNIKSICANIQDYIL